MERHIFLRKPSIAWCAAALIASQTTWAGPAAKKSAAAAQSSVINNIAGTLPSGTATPDITLTYICPQSGGAVKFGNAFPLSNSDYIGAEIRIGGCDYNDSYVGWLGLDNSGSQAVIVEFTPDGSGYVWKQMAISNGALQGKIDYAPIEDNLHDNSITPPVSFTRKLPYIGVNLAGAEFGGVISPGSVPDLSGTTASIATSDLAALGKYVQRGLNTVRLPFSWSYLQLLQSGTSVNQNPVWIFNESYWTNFLRPAIRTLTKAKITTILDLHTYLHYAEYGTNICGESICPDGSLVTNPDHYVAVWKAIWDHIENDADIDKNYIMFDLVNEPAANDKKKSEKVTPQQAFDAQIKVVTTLFSAPNNFPGKILIEGAYWSGLHSWSLNGSGNTLTNAQVFTRANINAKLVAANINSNRINDVIINVHQYFDSDFSGTQRTCLTDLTTTGAAGFNLQSFATWLTGQGLKAMVTEFGVAAADPGKCKPMLRDFTQYMLDNGAAPDGSTGGFIGATLWGSGHAFEPAYELYLTPDSYQYKTFIQKVTGP